MKLYKYQTINKNSISCLVSKKLWYSSPKGFNDPFEFKLRDLKLEEIKDREWISSLRKQENGDKLGDDDSILNDIYNLYYSEINKFGIVCYSELNNNILMWSHYADNHKGICLGFEFNDTNSSGVYPVKYSDDYPNLEFTPEKIWSLDGMSKIMFQKSDCWAYEKEWRTIVVEGNVLHEYKGTLKEVIFGCRTNKEDRNLIMEILKENKIEFHEAFQDGFEFKLNIKKM